MIITATNEIDLSTMRSLEYKMDFIDSEIGRLQNRNRYECCRHEIPRNNSRIAELEKSKINLQTKWEKERLRLLEELG